MKIDLTKMKTMKRFPIFAAALLMAALLISSPAVAGTDRPLTVQELPAQAQQFLRDHFSENKIAYAKVDDDWFDKEYKVVFVDGSKVEFDRSGAWKQVECKYDRIPQSIVPKPVSDRLNELYGEHTIIGIERDRRKYEVKLSNRLEVTFDSSYRVVDIDD